MAAELAEQPHLTPLDQSMRVNTWQDRTSPGIRDAISNLQRIVAQATAGMSLSLTERPAAWLDHLSVTAFPKGAEWTLKSIPTIGFGRGGTPDAGWGIARFEGDSALAGDLTLVRPATTQWLDANVTLTDPGTPDTVARWNIGTPDFWPGATQLIGATNPVTIAVPFVNTSPLENFGQARSAAQDARKGAVEDIRRRLDVAMASHAQLPPHRIVEYLADDIGMGQLITARAIGVSPTAVRKWRRGDATKAEHRGRLAKFAALASLLTELGPFDPAGWLDVPISIESTLTPVDLFVAGRADLVVLHGAQHASPQETLDSFDAQWREKYPSDPDYEVVTLKDGERSAFTKRTEKRP